MTDKYFYTADVRGLTAKIYLSGQEAAVAEFYDRETALRAADCLNACSELSTGALKQGVVKRMAALIVRMATDYPLGIFANGAWTVLRTANGIIDDLGCNKPKKGKPA